MRPHNRAILDLAETIEDRARAAEDANMQSVAQAHAQDAADLRRLVHGAQLPPRATRAGAA